MPSLSFQRKLWIPFFCSLVCIAAIFGADAWQLRGVRMQERRAALADVNHAANSAIARLGARAAAGELSTAAAQQQAVALIDSLRYGADSYVTILRQDGVVVHNPGNPAADGSNMLAFRDAAGSYLMRDLIALSARDGKGYARFMWLRPGAAAPSAKLAYISTYRPWGWIVLTGVYTDDIDAALRESLASSSVLLLAASAVLIVISVLINRSLGALLGGAPEYATSAARRIAANDLSSPILTRRGDDASLLHAMQTMQGKLAAALHAIGDSAVTIAAGAGQIAAGNADLSARTENQAASLEETAASIEQLTGAVANNADGAVQATALAREAAAVAGQAGDAMQALTATMGEISGASGRIADIIGVIDGIAFQTNILALNAAVEAARAGEQGRGFAVVASEVRTLAQRSAFAAKDIKVLIDDSASRIAAGERQALQAGGTMRQVVAGIGEVAELLGAISLASQEQSGGIHQVNQAIGSLDAITQQNAALVEESAAAAHSMRLQSEHMAALVRRFKLAPPAADDGRSSPRLLRHAGAPV